MGYPNCTTGFEAVGFAQGCCASCGQRALGTSLLQAGLSEQRGKGPENTG